MEERVRWGFTDLTDLFGYKAPDQPFVNDSRWIPYSSIGQKTILMNPITVHNTQNLKKIIAEIQTTMKRVHGAIQLTPISDLNIAIYQNVAL